MVDGEQIPHSKRRGASSTQPMEAKEGVAITNKAPAPGSAPADASKVGMRSRFLPTRRFPAAPSLLPAPLGLAPVLDPRPCPLAPRFARRTTPRANHSYLSSTMDLPHNRRLPSSSLLTGHHSTGLHRGDRISFARWRSHSGTDTPGVSRPHKDDKPLPFRGQPCVDVNHVARARRYATEHDGTCWLPKDAIEAPVPQPWIPK